LSVGVLKIKINGESKPRQGISNKRRRSSGFNNKTIKFNVKPKI
jgi:hypothetical protein